MFDVIVVGAGAAGLTAAMYLCRKNLKTAVFSVDIGGQVNLSSCIENYPGVEPVSGHELKKRFLDSAARTGAEIVTAKVVKVDKKDSGFEVVLGDGKKFESRAVILCSGVVPRELGIPGEKKFLGKGLSTCTTCDAPLYRNKVVAVIGGGNSAAEGALELVKTGAEKVYLVHRRNEFRADEITMAEVEKEGRIEVVTPFVPAEILGDRFVSGLKVRHSETGGEKNLEVSGVFKEVGFVVDNNAFKHLVKINRWNEVEIDAKNQTSVPGIFAAGDLTSMPYKQIVISAGEGAKAALSCYQWLTGNKSTIDWAK